MTLEEWLKDVYYDQYGQYLWSKQDADGGSQMIGEIRGWGALQNAFKTPEEASKFQDEVGKFIADAINEKVHRTFSKPLTPLQCHPATCCGFEGCKREINEGILQKEGDYLVCPCGKYKQNYKVAGL